MADEGEREPAKEWVDQAERKKPSWMAMGAVAVAEGRGPSEEEAARVEWLAEALRAVEGAEMGRFVCRVRGAVEGARMCQRGM
jgi:hypothetical protein